MRRRPWSFVALGLALAVSGLATAVALTLRDVDEALHPPRRAVEMVPQWPHENVSLETTDGVVLSAWYHPPANGAVVVLAHGHGENREQMLPEADLLAHAGFGILLFDWRAHGESGGTMSTRGDLERLDLKAAIDWVAGRPEMATGRLGVLGFSRGGTVAIEVAATDERIGAVIAQAPVTSLREGLDGDFQRFGALSQLAARLWVRARGVDVDSVRPIARIGDIAPRPVMLVHGSIDRSVAPHMALLLYRAATEPKHLWLISGAGHGDYERHAGPEYAARIASFFERSLLGSSSDQP